MRKLTTRPKYPMFLRAPSGDVTPIPETVTTISALTTWIQTSGMPIVQGQYLTEFLPEDDIELTMDAITLYEDGWGVSRVADELESPLIDTTVGSEDLRLFLDHITSQIPSETARICMTAAEEDLVPLGCRGKQGLSLYFMSKDEAFLTSIDIYWGVTYVVTSITLPWRLPFISASRQRFLEETVIVPKVNEAIAIVEGIRSRLNCSLTLAFSEPGTTGA